MLNLQNHPSFYPRFILLFFLNEMIILAWNVTNKAGNFLVFV